MNDNIKFKGIFCRYLYNTNDFCIAVFDVDSAKYPEVLKNNYGNVVAKGNCDFTLINGVEYEIVATLTESKKYGKSYDFSSIVRDIPTTLSDKKDFLSEILTKTQAEVLLNAYPNIIDMVVNNEDDKIDFSKLKYITQKNFNKIKMTIIENFALVNIIPCFKGYISVNKIRKIFNEYKSIDKFKEALRRNPYSCLCKISGIGFKVADGILLKLEELGKKDKSNDLLHFENELITSKNRCLEAIKYVLSENETEGHTRISFEDLYNKCIALTPEAISHIDKCLEDEDVYIDSTTKDIGLLKTYNKERYIAETLINNNIENVWNIDVNNYKVDKDYELTDEQLKALDNLNKYNISILNGYAGSGKSATISAIVKMLDDNKKRYKLFAPTGRAAKVLSKYTNKNGMTIHRGLEFNPTIKPSWVRCELNPLDTDVVIVDEFSMADVNLFYRLLKAINFKNQTKLVLVGDNAQLPSVSCGNLLHDILNSNIIPTSTLTNIFRYSDGGLMKIATDVRSCCSYLNNANKEKVTKFGKNNDYIYYDCEQDLIVNNILKIYKKMMETCNIDDIQVLISQKKGDCGTVYLNNEIQKLVNPYYGTGKVIKIGDTQYYTGDSVLQNSNNYEALVYINNIEDSLEFEEITFIANGEKGKIVDIIEHKDEKKSTKTEYIIIDFDGKKIVYNRGDMIKLSLGYAITIHKSQGGSADNIILVTPRKHTYMLNSNLIYVGLTRTKKKCIHLGNYSTINRAVGIKANLDRKTFLPKLLLEFNCIKENTKGDIDE